MKMEFIIGALIVIAGLLCAVKPDLFAGKGHGVKSQQKPEIRRTGIIVSILGALGLLIMALAYYKL